MTGRDEQENIIMAIDAGSRYLGFCVAYGGQYVSSWTHETAGDDPSLRIAEIARYTARQLRRYQPAVIAIEEPKGDHGNRHTDRVLGRVCGAIEAAVALDASEEPRQILWINPMDVKGTGFCKDTLQAVRNLVRKDDLGPDEADAVGIWLVAVGQLQAHRFMNLTAEEGGR